MCLSIELRVRVMLSNSVVSMYFWEYSKWVLNFSSIAIVSRMSTAQLPLSSLNNPTLSAAPMM